MIKQCDSDVLFLGKQYLLQPVSLRILASCMVAQQKLCSGLIMHFAISSLKGILIVISVFRHIGTDAMH